MRNVSFPIFSLAGLGLFSLTLAVHLCFRLIPITDMGVGMLLSLANALLLLFTLAWGFLGIMEFRFLLRARRSMRAGLADKTVEQHEAAERSKRLRLYWVINVGYLLLVAFQLVYVIFNWDEINV